MKNDLTLLTGSLNITKTVEEINKAIKKIEKHPKLSKVKLSVDFDQKYTKSVDVLLSSGQQVIKHFELQKKLIEEIIAKNFSLGEAINRVTQRIRANIDSSVQATKHINDRRSAILQESDAILTLISNMERFEAKQQDLLRVQSASEIGSNEASKSVESAPQTEASPVSNPFEKTANDFFKDVNIDAFKKLFDTSMVSLFFEAIAQGGLKFKALSVFAEIYTSSTVKARIATVALQSALSLGLSVAIGAVVSGLTYLYNKYEEEKQQQIELEKQTRQTTESWTAHKDEILELVNTYNYLQAVTQNGQLFTNHEQEQSYLDVIERLSTLMPGLVASIDEKGQKHLKSTEAIQREIENTEKLSKIQLRIDAHSAKDNYKDKINEINKLNKEIAKIERKKSIKNRQAQVPASSRSQETQDEFIRSRNIELGKLDLQIINTQQKIASSSDELLNSVSSSVEGILKLRDIEFNPETSKEIKNIINSLDSEIVNDESKLEEFTTSLAELAEILSDGIVSYKEKERFVQLKNALQLSDEAVNNLTNSFKENNEEVKSLKSVNELSGDLKYFNNILSTVEQGQKLNADAASELIQKYPELADNVHKMSDGWSIEKDAIEDVRSKKLDLLNDSILAENGITENYKTELEARLKGYGIELDAINDVASAKLAAAEIKGSEAIPENIKRYLPEGAAKKIDATAERDRKAILDHGEKMNYVAKFREALSSSKYGVSGSNSGSRSSSSSKDKAAYESRFKINKLEDAVNKANAELDKNLQKLDEAIASGKDYDKVLNNRLTLYDNLTKALDNLKNSHVKQQQELRGVLGKAGLLDKNGDVIENVGKKLESIANSGTETIQGHSIQTIESFVEQYLNLPQQINDADSKLNQAVMGIADTFGKGLERIQNTSGHKQAKSKHKIAMLGEINTTEEKELLAKYTEEIVQNIVNERKQINDEIYKTQQFIRSSKSTDAQKRAAEIYLKTLLDAQNNKYEEVVAQSEDLGKKQADALISGFEDQIKELEFQKSLLGSLDTPEKQQAAKDIDKAIASVYAQAAQSIESQTAELTRKVNQSQSITEKSRTQAKLDALNEYQRTVLKQISDMNNAEWKARSDRADSIIENYKKMLQKEKELREQAIEEEIRVENERHNNKVKHLDDELKRYEDIINAQLKSLDRANAEEDYEAKFNKLMKERQDIADKINVLALDNSFEAKAKKKALQEQLDSKNEEIDKFKLDRERELVKEGLSDQLEDRRRTIEKERELADKQHEDTLDKLDQEKRKVERHYKQILEDEKYFYDMKQSLLSEDKVAVYTALDEIQSKYDSFFAYLEGQSELFGKKIADNMRYGFEQDYKNTQEYRDTVDSSGKAPSGSSGVPGHAGGGKQTEDADKQRSWKEYLANKQRAESLTKQVIQLQRTDPNSIDIVHIKEEINKLRKLNNDYRNKYNFPDQSYDQLKNMKPFSAKSGGMTPPWGGNNGKFLLAHEKEIILNQSDSFNLLKVVDITRNVVDSIRNMKLPSLTQQQNTTHAGTTIQNLHVAITGAFGPKDGGDMAASLINGLKARGVNI
ncbi:hypothetical protein LQV63_09915 [Paenibacillus profundus]|uniref:Phage tail tape measure protein n=1 Tax=Paenibacillus profundus TaxID=1173085 RepID=A0ABS8YGL3_9BACL|nr:hypothetical protein [Paenibacillus profundus]MCE5169628.1 hypothetical protein [Paenibacillus profundus]